MAQKSINVRSRLGLSALLLACSGCVVPNPPVPTIWQRLGIPQADSAFRSGVLNRKGEFPQLEKKPPLLPISDPQNLASENPLLKNAAEIKKDKDLKPQKIKALKYLASVGCVCPSEKDKVEEALLQGLADCDCEVRLAALEAICAAIQTCGPCGTNPCGSSCCTEAIRKKLEEMANKTDAKGCFVEPSAQLRKMAAAVLAACPPVDKPVKPEAGVKPEGGDTKAEGDEKDERDGKDEKDEDASPSDNPAEPAVFLPESVRIKVSSAEYGEMDISPVVFHSSSSTTAADNHSPFSPDQAANLVKCVRVEATDAAEQIVVVLPGEFNLKVGAKMAVVAADSSVTVGEILTVEGSRLTLKVEETTHTEQLVLRGAKIGLVAE